MNRSKQSGIVLVTTMMVIALLALFTLSQLQLLLLNIKALNLIKTRHQAFSTLETAAAKIVQNINLSKQEGCIFSEQDPKDLIELLTNKKGCVLTHEKQVFYYFIEDLGLFSCLQAKVENQKFSLQHLRLSLLFAEKKQPGFLQLRLARLVKLMDCEKQEPREAKTGIISWRYLLVPD